jgi:hypothetical protein
VLTYNGSVTGVPIDDPTVIGVTAFFRVAYRF